MLLCNSIFITCSPLLVNRGKQLKEELQKCKKSSDHAWVQLMIREQLTFSKPQLKSGKASRMEINNLLLGLTCVN